MCIIILRYFLIRIDKRRIAGYMFGLEIVRLYLYMDLIEYVASIVDGATVRQDVYLISSVSENSNVLSI